MPRTKSGLFDNRKYQNEYHRAMRKKTISFNPNSEEDMRMLAHIESKPNETQYLKNLIRKDMAK